MTIAEVEAKLAELGQRSAEYRTQIQQNTAMARGLNEGNRALVAKRREIMQQAEELQGELRALQQEANLAAKADAEPEKVEA